MYRGRLLIFGLAFPFFLFACYFTSFDPEAFDHVATAASFAQGEGTIASLVAGTTTAEAGVNGTELRVVYVDNGDLWAWTQVSGSELLYAPTLPINDLRISDDGEVIVFLLGDAPGNIALWEVNINGSNLRILLDATSLARLDVTELSSSAVSQLLTATTNSSFSDPEADQVPILFGELDPEGDSWNLWLQDLGGDAILIASPTGRSILFDFAGP